MQSNDPLYLGGIALFNRGAYFESHEVWEGLWKACQGPAKLFYKGLIQAAVALHHADHGNLHGAWKLYRRSSRALDCYRPCYLGLNVDRFLAQVAVRLATPERPNRPQIELAPPEELGVPARPSGETYP